MSDFQFWIDGKDDVCIRHSHMLQSFYIMPDLMVLEINTLYEGLYDFLNNWVLLLILKFG